MRYSDLVGILELRWQNRFRILLPRKDFAKNIPGPAFLSFPTTGGRQWDSAQRSLERFRDVAVVANPDTVTSFYLFPYRDLWTKSGSVGNQREIKGDREIKGEIQV